MDEAGETKKIIKNIMNKNKSQRKLTNLIDIRNRFKI